MTKDVEWEALVGDWKSNDVPAPGLARRVRRGTWAAYGGIALSVGVMGLLAVATVPVLAHAGGHPVVYACAAFVLLLGGGVAATSLRTLLGTLRPEAQSTRAYVELEKRRALGELRAVKTIRASVLVMLAFDAVWAPWKIYVDRAGYAAEPWRLVVGFGWHFVILALLWAPTSLARRKQEARLAALEELARAGRED